MKTPNVWPEGPKLLIEVDEAESTSKGGIIIPQNVRAAEQRRLTMGTVLRCGPNADVRFEDGVEFSVGSRIIFAKYGGFLLKDVGDRSKDYRLINDEDVLAIIE